MNSFDLVISWLGIGFLIVWGIANLKNNTIVSKVSFVVIILCIVVLGVYCMFFQ